MTDTEATEAAYNEARRAAELAFDEATGPAEAECEETVAEARRKLAKVWAAADLVYTAAMGRAREEALILRP
jgi:uncharacterized membrane protein YqiK